MSLYLVLKHIKHLYNSCMWFCCRFWQLLLKNSTVKHVFCILFSSPQGEQERGNQCMLTNFTLGFVPINFLPTKMTYLRDGNWIGYTSVMLEIRADWSVCIKSSDTFTMQTTQCLLTFVTDWTSWSKKMCQSNEEKLHNHFDSQVFELEAPGNMWEALNEQTKQISTVEKYLPLYSADSFCFAFLSLINPF